MNFTLTIDENDLRIIIAGLGELPMKYSQAVHDKIRAQVESQKEPVPVDHSDKPM